mgnify:FL=1
MHQRLQNACCGQGRQTGFVSFPFRWGRLSTWMVVCLVPLLLGPKTSVAPLLSKAHIEFFHLDAHPAVQGKLKKPVEEMTPEEQQLAAERAQKKEAKRIRQQASMLKRLGKQRTALVDLLNVHLQEIDRNVNLTAAQRTRRAIAAKGAAQ